MIAHIIGGELEQPLDDEVEKRGTWLTNAILLLPNWDLLVKEMFTMTEAIIKKTKNIF